MENNITTINKDSIIANKEIVNISKGFDDTSIRKYTLELTHVNNFLRNSKPDQKQKIIAALNEYPEYSHQKIAELSSIGLSIANSDYYIIPYGTSPKFDIDYKGLLKVASIEARKNGFQLISKADTIRKGFTRADVVTNSLIDDVFIENGKINSDILTAYAIISLLDVETHKIIMQKVEIMPVLEFENAKKASKGGTVHKDYGTEMGKKMALRRCVKILNTMFASDMLDKLFQIDNESYVMASSGDIETKQISDKKNINSILD
jgi:recombinational DNA repair protein RecT